MTSPGVRDIPAAPSATLRWAVWLLWAEAAALAVVAGFLLYEDLTAKAADIVAGLAITGYTAGLAVVLALCGVHLRRRRSWPRGLAIALQIILVFLSMPMIRAGLIWLGLPALAVAVAIIGLLVAPPTREALGIR